MKPGLRSPPPPATPLNTPNSFVNMEPPTATSNLHAGLDEVRARIASAPAWGVALAIAALPLGGLLISAMCIGIPLAIVTLPLWLPVVMFIALVLSPIWVPMLIIFLLAFGSAVAMIVILVFWDHLPLRLRSGLLQFKASARTFAKNLGLGADVGGGDS